MYNRAIPVPVHVETNSPSRPRKNSGESTSFLQNSFSKIQNAMNLRKRASASSNTSGEGVLSDKEDAKGLLNINKEEDDYVQMLPINVISHDHKLSTSSASSYSYRNPFSPNTRGKINKDNIKKDQINKNETLNPFHSTNLIYSISSPHPSSATKTPKVKNMRDRSNSDGAASLSSSKAKKNAIHGNLVAHRPTASNPAVFDDSLNHSSNPFSPRLENKDSSFDLLVPTRSASSSSGVSISPGIFSLQRDNPDASPRALTPNLIPNYDRKNMSVNVRRASLLSSHRRTSSSTTISHPFSPVSKVSTPSPHTSNDSKTSNSKLKGHPSHFVFSPSGSGGPNLIFSPSASANQPPLSKLSGNSYSNTIVNTYGSNNSATNIFFASSPTNDIPTINIPVTHATPTVSKSKSPNPPSIQIPKSPIPILQIPLSREESIPSSATETENFFLKATLQLLEERSAVSSTFGDALKAIDALTSFINEEKASSANPFFKNMPDLDENMQRIEKFRFWASSVARKSGEGGMTQSNAVLSGYLQKLNSSGVKWQKRFVVIDPPNLIYYTASDMIKGKLIPLENTNCKFLSKSNQFELVLTGGDETNSNNRKSYKWMADSVEDVRKWMLAIQKATQFSPKLREIQQFRERILKAENAVSFIDICRDMIILSQSRPFIMPIDFIRKHKKSKRASLNSLSRVIIERVRSGVPDAQNTMMQVNKDMMRDCIVINNTLHKSESGEKVIEALSKEILKKFHETLGVTEEHSPFMAHANAIAFARRVLLSSARTVSGGDMYDAIQILFESDLVVVVPDSTTAEPVQITVQANDVKASPTKGKASPLIAAGRHSRNSSSELGSDKKNPNIDGSYFFNEWVIDEKELKCDNCGRTLVKPKNRFLCRICSKSACIECCRKTIYDFKNTQYVKVCDTCFVSNDGREDIKILADEQSTLYDWPLVTASLTSVFKIQNLDPSDEDDQTWAKIIITFNKNFRWLWPPPSAPDDGYISMIVTDVISEEKELKY